VILLANQRRTKKKAALYSKFIHDTSRIHTVPQAIVKTECQVRMISLTVNNFIYRFGITDELMFLA
jgi:hypothetical protein